MTDDIRFDDYEFEIFNLDSNTFDVREDTQKESSNELKRKSSSISNVEEPQQLPPYQDLRRRTASSNSTQTLAGKIENLNSMISSLENELKDSQNVRIKILKNIYQNQVNVYSQQMNPTNVENRKRRLTSVMEYTKKSSSGSRVQMPIQNVIPKEIVSRMVRFAKFNMYEEFENDLCMLPNMVNAYNYDGTPLIFSAIYAKSTLFIKRFQQMGNNFMSLSHHGQTIFHYAVLMNADMCIIQYLNGEFPFMVNYPDSNGDTPLHLAIRAKNLPLVQFLVTIADMRYVKNEQMTYLHAAIIESSQEVIDFMMVNCKRTNYNGNTIFMLCAMYNRKLEIGMICNEDFTAVNIHDENVLFCLVRGSHSSLMNAIIARNHNLLDQVNIAGRSLLHYAARSLKINEFIHLYLQCSTDIHNHKCDDGWNILTDAIVFCNPHVANFLYFMGHPIQKMSDLKSARDYNPGLVNFALEQFCPHEGFIKYLSDRFKI